MPQRRAVACLGNPIMGDDAFGILVARELEGLRGADLLTLEGGGLDVSIKLVPYSEVLLIDALETPNGKVGEVLRLSVERLAGMPGLSGHGLGLAQALEAVGLLTGGAPREVEILACRIRPVDEYREGVSPEVARAARRCASLAREWAASGAFREKP
ncbi:MAG TPA: hydrogenase maturation protease [Conexivisphaerales archaeon]|nr:hydrogenase maturation protease [Conexivisphaerales archaeon]